MQYLAKIRCISCGGEFPSTTPHYAVNRIIMGHVSTLAYCVECYQSKRNRKKPSDRGAAEKKYRQAPAFPSSKNNSTLPAEPAGREKTLEKGVSSQGQAHDFSRGCLT
jgi:hypothetical protein